MSAEPSRIAGAPARGWKPYPAYKDSGVEWLGKVPEEWKVQKLKHIAKVNLSNVDKKTNEGEDSVKLCNYVDVYYNDYITPDLNFMEATASPDQIEKFALREGDVIITKDSESWEDIAVPAYVPADLNGVICGYHLAHVRPNHLDIQGHYLFWSLCAPRLNHQFRVEAHGITRFGIGKYGIDNSLFVVPPINAQKFIARFLDDRTRKIDSLIEKKQKLIELLKEERAAVINHAVTKGLDPRAPMRDSGVGWLGEVPEKWEVKKLKYVAEINRYALNENTNSDYEFQYIDIGNVTIEGLTHSPQLMKFKDAPSRARRIVKKGDTIVSTVRTYLKAIAYIEDKADNLIASTGFAVLTSKGMLDSKFLYCIIINEKIIEAINSLSTGVSYPAINSSDLANIVIWFPKEIKVQQEIVNFIESGTAKIYHAVDKMEKEIELLHEYRTALISEVVTGKIDVRGE